MQNPPGWAGTDVDVRAAFADPAFTAAQARNAPFAVLDLDAGEVRWANLAAATHFSTVDAAALRGALLGPDGWLGGAVNSVSPGRPPRFVRAGLTRELGLRAYTVLMRAWTSEDGSAMVGFAVPDAPIRGTAVDDWLRPAWADLATEASAPAGDPPAELDGKPGAGAGLALARRGQVAVLRDRLSQAIDGVAAPRLLWRADADGVVTPVDAGLLARLGVPLDFARAPLPMLLARFDPDGARRLTAALEARETWSGLSVDLPLAGGAAKAPLLLSASPTFGPDRSFTGFRGFGMLDLGRLDVGSSPSDAGAEPEESTDAPSAVQKVPDGPDQSAANSRVGAAEGAAAAANVVQLRAFQTPAPARGPVPPTSEVDDAEPDGNRDAAPEDDDSAFRALGEALRARIGAPSAAESTRPAGPAADASTPPAEGARLPEPGLLERLPIGILAVAEGVPVYANPAGAAQLGFRDPGLVLAAGAGLIVSDGEPLRLREAGGGIASVPSRRSAASWAGAPATLFVLEPPALGPAPAAAAADMRGAQAGELLDRVDDAVLSLDPEGRLRRLNRRGEAWFGPLVSRTPRPALAQLLAPDSRPLALALLAEARSRNVDAPPLSGEVRASTAEGGTLPFLLTVGRLGASDFYATMREMASVRGAGPERVGAERDRSGEGSRSAALLAKVNHEIRIPLSAILGFAEVMMDERFGPLGNSRYAEYLRDIHAAGSRVVALVEDLLDLSRIEAGAFELAPAPLDVNRIVSEAVAAMQSEAHRGRIIMRTSLAGRLPSALADDRSARQIVQNLLSNAVKFNEPGGQVIVSTALGEGRTVLLRVRDTGVGMTEDEIAAALEPLDQAAAARPANGNGLGLPLTRALAGANGASIAIRSRPREGTLVEVAFVAAESGEARRPA